MSERNLRKVLTVFIFLDVDRTSMKQYVQMFEHNVLKPLEIEAKQKLREKKESSAAFTGDW